MGREAYENHVRRLMFILDQEQQARLRVEDKLEDARVRISALHQCMLILIYKYMSVFSTFCLICLALCL